MAAKKTKSKKAQRKVTKPAKGAAKKTPPRKALARTAKPSRASAKPAKRAKVAKPATRTKSAKPIKLAAKPAKKVASAARKKVIAAPKKPLPSKAPKAKAAKKAALAAPTTNGVRRHDRAGHLDPRYAAQLRAKSLESREASDAEPAFVKGARSSDDLAEEFGEEAVESMTTGEDEGEDARNQFVDEEIGGPFVETSGKTEFANDNDESNPEDATREPFPKS